MSSVCIFNSRNQASISVKYEEWKPQHLCKWVQHPEIFHTHQHACTLPILLSIRAAIKGKKFRRLICSPSTEFFLAIWENFLVGFPFKTLSTWRSCTSNLNSQKIRLLSMNSLMKLWKFIFKYKRSLIATLFFFSSMRWFRKRLKRLRANIFHRKPKLLVVNVEGAVNLFQKKFPLQSE